MTHHPGLDSEDRKFCKAAYLPIPPHFPGCLPGQHSLAQSLTLRLMNAASNLL